MPGGCSRMDVAQRRLSRCHQGQYQPHRRFRCPVLEPVLEHYEAPLEEEGEEEQGSHVPRQCQTAATAKKGLTPKLRILSRLRDGYVKLMNDVACRVDSSGFSSFYGCPAGGGAPVYYSAAFHEHLRKEEVDERPEKEQVSRLQAMRLNVKSKGTIGRSKLNG